MQKPFFLLMFWLFCLSAFSQDTTKHAIAGNCDVITLKNGKLIYCRETSIKHHKVMYKNCGDTIATLNTLPADSVLMVTHPNGTSETVKYVTEHNKEMRPWFGVMIGISEPEFKFKSSGPMSGSAQGSTDAHRNAVDDALPNTIYTVTGCVPIYSPKWGITVGLGYSQYPFDANAYTHAADFADNLPGALNSHYNPISWSAGSYTLAKFMVGFFYSIQKDIVSFNIGLRFGCAYCEFPDIAYTTTDYLYPPGKDTIENITIDKTHTLSGLAVEISTVLKFNVYKRVGFFISMDYFSCNTNFPFHLHGAAANGNIIKASDVAAVGYRLFDFTAGLTYNFGK